MRTPTVSRRRPFRVRAWIVVTIVVLVVLLFSLRGISFFYTDYLWFSALHLGGVWRELIWARLAPAIVFAVLFFAMMFASLTVADRLAPKVRTSGPEDELFERYRSSTQRYSGRIRVAISALFALIAGASVSGQWQSWILFRNAVPFHVKDPEFHVDVGFYVFKLPFLQFVVDWLFFALLVILVVTAIAHYANGGIRLQQPYQHVTPQVKAHLSVILALMALVKGVGYFLARFQLNFSTRGVVEGAGYTDVHADLYALQLLIAIAVIAAALFIWNIWRRGWVLPIIAVGLWALVSVIVGAIYPAAVQKFSVDPNEFQKEQPYIIRNIQATRDAFGLAHVGVEPYPYQQSPAPSVVAAALPTLNDARRWDPTPMLTYFTQNQAKGPFYKFPSPEFDRYTINGQTVPVLMSVRELNHADIPSQTWVNNHLVYTHGYGAVVAPANQVSPDLQGGPVYLLGNLPPLSGTPAFQDTPGADSAPVPGLTLDQPRAYFSLGENGYSLVDGHNGKQTELDYRTALGQEQTNSYNGKGGIPLSNPLRRAAFAIRYGDFNLFISGEVTPSSKILIRRDVMSRVEAAAPFLQFDSDPYPIIVGGRIKWMLDGYTTSNRYPYSQAYSGSGGLSGKVNYVRNSVKVVVDAYDGTMKFYVIDTKDPIIRAYEKAFPQLFSPGSSMPAEVRAHLRYPQDLFNLQTDVYSLYHMTDAGNFYTKSDLWTPSPDPGTEQPLNTAAISAAAGAVAPPSTGRTNSLSATGERIAPIYMLMQLPGQQQKSFVLLRPFAPISRGNTQNYLVSFMVAGSDPGQYGDLTSYVMPSVLTVNGPEQDWSSALNTPDISTQFTLLNQANSTVIPGSMQLVPVGNSIVYIRPIYVQAQSSSQFQASRYVVAVVSGGQAVLGCSVNDAFAQLFQHAPPDVSCRTSGAGGVAPTPTPTPPSPGSTTTAPAAPSTPPPAPAPGATVAQLLQQASQAFQQAQAALRAGNLGQYQQLIDQVGQLLAQAQALEAGSPGAPGAGGATGAALGGGRPASRG